MNELVVKKLGWDSEFFGQRIHSLDVERLVRDHAEGMEWPSEGLVQAKIRAGDNTAIDLVQREGFRFAEGETGFAKLLHGGLPAVPELRRAAREDSPAVVRLAGEAFEISRFREPWFRAADSSRLYSEWARKAVLGQYDDVCLVMEEQGSGQIIGLVTAKAETNAGSARIGLICVAKRSRGSGVARRLLAGIERWAGDKALTRIRVATQSGNIAACSLYSRSGYLIESVSYWFYR